MPKQTVTIEVDVPEGYVAECTGGTAKHHGCTVRFAFVPAKPRYFAPPIGTVSEWAFFKADLTGESYYEGVTGHNRVARERSEVGHSIGALFEQGWREVSESEALARVKPQPKARYFKGETGHTYRVMPDGSDWWCPEGQTEWKLDTIKWTLDGYLQSNMTEISEAEAMARIQPKPKPEVVCARCGWEGKCSDTQHGPCVTALNLVTVVCPQCGSRNWDFHDTRETK